MGGQECLFAADVDHEVGVVLVEVVQGHAFGNAHAVEQRAVGAGALVGRVGQDQEHASCPLVGLVRHGGVVTRPDRGRHGWGGLKVGFGFLKFVVTAARSNLV